MLKDITGQKFNMLTAVRECGRDKRGKTLWEFQCDCGNTVINLRTYVVNGVTKSCGCLKNNGSENRKHGGSKEKLYKVYCNIKKVSETENVPICSEWTVGYEAFRTWAYENGYKDKARLVRRDAEQGFNPDNCLFTAEGFRKDLTGKTFGRLKVLGFSRLDTQTHHSVWNCKCECGKFFEVVGNALLTGNTKSCGCLPEHSLFDGVPKTQKRVYSVWSGMMARCYNENNVSYGHYGARGIKVCENWKDFRTFYQWAKETGYDENAPRGVCTIERIDVNGDYEPNNCTWVDTMRQTANRTISRNVLYHGKATPLSIVCEAENIPYHKLYYKVFKAKCDLETAIKNYHTQNQ